MEHHSKIIYFVAPSGIATGGPEAIHRLCKFLIDDLELDVRILYLPEGEKNPVHPNYLEFNIPIANKIEDEHQNLIVLPDYYPHLMLGKSFTKIRIWIWWLSIDFFYKTFHDENSSAVRLILERYGSAALRILAKKYPFISGNRDAFNRTMLRYSKLRLSTLNPISKCDRHLCQSFYAEDFLRGMGLSNVTFLGDFTDYKILDASYDIEKKRNIVLYSPAKGLNFSRKIINEGQEISFIPLTRLSRHQLTDLLQIAKVYMDFGNHPGRDRIPREAAMYGCCIITSLRGSAKYFEDIPIPSEYKFIDVDENIPLIVRKIGDIFADYELKVRDFDNYRSFIVDQDRLAYDQARKEFLEILNT
jgi:hypothetical protein